MRVLAVALILLVLLLAGCSSAPAASTSSSSFSASASMSSGPVPKPVPPTDTLHLMEAPAVALVAPKGTEPNETALPTSQNFVGVGGNNAGGLDWEHTLGSNATFSGYQATVWVRVIDQLVATPDNPPACAWSLFVRIPDPEGNGVQNKVSYTTTCSGPQGPVIAPGDYELSFSASAPAGDAAAAAGDTVRMTLRRSGFAPTPNESVVVLTGSKEFDSKITFTGLKEPVA